MVCRGVLGPPRKIRSTKDLGSPGRNLPKPPVLPTYNFQNTDTAELDEIRQLATIILSHSKTIHLLRRSS